MPTTPTTAHTIANLPLKEQVDLVRDLESKAVTPETRFIPIDLRDGNGWGDSPNPADRILAALGEMPYAGSISVGTLTARPDGNLHLDLDGVAMFLEALVENLRTHAQDDADTASELAQHRSAIRGLKALVDLVKEV